MRGGRPDGVAAVGIDRRHAVGGAAVAFQEHGAAERVGDVGLVLVERRAADVGEVAAPARVVHDHVALALAGRDGQAREIGEDPIAHERADAHGRVVAAGDRVADARVDAEHRKPGGQPQRRAQFGRLTQQRHQVARPSRRSPPSGPSPHTARRRRGSRRVDRAEPGFSGAFRFFRFCRVLVRQSAATSAVIVAASSAAELLTPFAFRHVGFDLDDGALGEDDAVVAGQHGEHAGDVGRPVARWHCSANQARISPYGGRAALIERQRHVDARALAGAASRDTTAQRSARAETATPRAWTRGWAIAGPAIPSSRRCRP